MLVCPYNEAYMPATQITSSATPACFWAGGGVAPGLVLPFAREPFGDFASCWAIAPLPFWGS